MKSITITTDASYCPEENKGAFAFWISSDLGSIKKSGMLKACNTSGEAELMCIANAIHYFVNANLKCGMLYINTDYQAAADLMPDKMKPFSQKFIHVVLRKVAAILKEYGQPFVFRHVKAHVKVLQARGYVNTWCDKEAKRVLKANKLSKFK